MKNQKKKSSEKESRKKEKGFRNAGQKGKEIGTKMSGGAKKWEEEKTENYSPLKQDADEEGKSWRRKEIENF